MKALSPQSTTQTYSVGAGVEYALSPSWALMLDYRFLLTRGAVPGIGSINGGGSWIGLGVSYLFASDPGPTGLRP